MYVFTNKRSKQLCEMIIVDAAYYANWLSVVYGLKDRLLKKLLVFSSKIEDLTLFFVASLKTEGKWGKSLSFASKPPLRKDKVYRGLFRRIELQNQRWIHGSWGWLLCLDKVRIMSVLWARFLCLLQPKKESQQI